MQHRTLNDLAYFHARPPTAAYIALFAWRNLDVVLAPHAVKVEEVKVAVLGGCFGDGTGGMGDEGEMVVYRGEMG